MPFINRFTAQAVQGGGKLFYGEAEIALLDSADLAFNMADKLNQPDMFADVTAFLDKVGLGYQGPPRALPVDLWENRLQHLKEEMDEYAEASGVDGKAQELDALVDMAFIILGTARLHGFTKFYEAWRRVTKANMQKKRGPIVDHKQGVVKPSGWKPADLSDLVKP